MQYLSVHDLVWLNTTLTGTTSPFDYRSLEAVMAAQYGYGDSRNVPAQAAELLATALRERPFASGNARTAFVCVATFLIANGHAVAANDEQATVLVRAVESGEMDARVAIDRLSAATGAPLSPGADLRQLVGRIIMEFSGAIARLSEGD
ncbi:MAG: hypothetical protein IT208_12330 [Chthonomonadales bacterium]|nr:hypothetical protein [Chthonomonadales bacterium]